MRRNPSHNQFQHDRTSAIILCTELDVKAKHTMAKLAKASRQASTAAKNLNSNLIPIGNGTLPGMTKRSLQSRHTGLVGQPLRDELLVGHGIQLASEAADFTNSI